MKADELEELARRWCKSDGHDPDVLVFEDQVAIPFIATPFGNVKTSEFVQKRPLWHVYAIGIRNQINTLAHFGVVVSIPEKD